MSRRPRLNHTAAFKAKVALAALKGEFDPSHTWFNNKTAVNDSFRHLRQVSYVTDREPTYLLTAKDDEVLYTKTCDWEFENEWRMIRDFNEGKKGPKQDPYGKDVFHFEIPPSTIKTIVFGYRAAPQLEDDLRKTVTANANLKHIVFGRAVRNVDARLKLFQMRPEFCDGEVEEYDAKAKLVCCSPN